jgi:hypothetical protein
MAYYSRYATKKKSAMLGFLLWQLVTSKPEACWFSWGSTDAIITIFIPTVRHSIIGMCSALTKYDLPLLTIMMCPWNFMWSSSCIPPRHGSWHWSLCTHLPFFSANCVNSISGHALKPSSTLKFPNHWKTSSLDLEIWARGSCILLWFIYQRMSHLID